MIVLLSSYSISPRCTERSAQYFQLAAVLRKRRGSPEDVISSGTEAAGSSQGY